jgi:5-methylcytosine-specific restriction protein A
MSIFKPCPHPGCPALSARGGLCAAHKQARQRTIDARRDPAMRRLYGARWAKASKAFRWAHPLCAECDRAGRLTPATVVDHVVPHRGDVAKFWDSDNWAALCKHHHDLKTARDDGGFGNRSTRRGGPVESLAAMRENRA